MIAGPTLAVGVRLGLTDGAEAFPTRTDEIPDAFDFTDVFIVTEQPTAYDLKIEIRPDNRVFLEAPRMEIGQGLMTTIGMLVADGLDVPFENMDIVLSPAEPKRANGQITAGSHTTRGLWDPVRLITARMRGQLLAAGSRRFGVPVSRLRTEDGYVVATDGQQASYGELAATAADLPEAEAAKPKTADRFTIIGRPRVRYGIEKIVQGTYPYASDVSIEGALPTVVAMPATHGARVLSVDDSKARKIPGVIAVTPVPGMPDYLVPEAVAVTAETFGIARKAKEALEITWSAGPMDGLSDAQIDDILNGIVDPVASPGEGIEATFRWPYVPHAPMDENNAVADVRTDRAEVWGSPQVPNTVHRWLTETLGMKPEQVIVHCVPGGGSFGRHNYHDQEIMAAQISQRIRRPVQLRWLREEGVRHGRCRPVSIHKVKATIADGDVVGWEHHLAGAELDIRCGLGDVISGYATEFDNEGACQWYFTHSAKLFYKTGPTTITLKQRLLAKPTGTWRNVYIGPFHAVNEIVVDEVARHLGRDEFEFRMDLLDSDRHRAVLKKCAEEAQWGRKLPPGVAQGIGMNDEYKSIVAYIAEIDVRGNDPRMTRCTIAMDNGFCVNPKATESSLIGQAMDGFAVVFRAGLHV
ncbi:MAG TPA: molybdopterin cofactor-binding domain-containing protein, partial [Acidimicrobiia bacterium]|nr:molybdopterin cofactor-binding domain-containing protein [Acidimicrobiia bacterium]